MLKRGERMKVAIVGGGASGLCCAVALKQKRSDIDITIFELRDRVGKKLLATGNGRCNMLNLNEDLASFSQIDFVSFILKKYNAQSNLKFFENLGLYTRHDEEGRVYPLSNQATSVLDALRFECEYHKVNFECGTEIESIKKQGNKLVLNNNFVFDKVVLCCGSKAGVKGYQSLNLVKELGIKTTKLTPSLTKICVKQSAFTKSLKGIRVKSVLKLYRNGEFVTQENGELLFAEYGISGIAAMQLSFYISKEISKKYTVKCDFVPELSFSALIKAIERIVSRIPNAKCENILSGFVPKKLGEAILKKANVSSKDNASTLNKNKISEIVSQLKGFSFDVAELKGFEDAQTVSGGVDLKEVNASTLECKKIKGLYFAGEMLDVDALCGGYNLWWAWSSARMCAESIAQNKN